MNHTQFYNDFWASKNNYNFQFYDNRTFGMDRENPCEVINDNPKYRKIMNKEFNCTGPWCINNTFNCIRGDSRNCYNVEHIIDLNGGEFKNASCKSIAANLVMSCGTWNQQLGSLSISTIGGYEANINEKKLVYSNNRIEMARNTIIKCNPSCELSDANESNETKSNMQFLNTKLDMFIGVLISLLISLVIGLVIGLVICYMHYKINNIYINDKKGNKIINPIYNSNELKYRYTEIILEK
jgi:tetrahydromethanopterin S-methyltransferase subunit G